MVINYDQGGMIYHIHARAMNGTTDSADSYEVAYRSVLVFVNANVNGNGNEYINGNTTNQVRGNKTNPSNLTNVGQGLSTNPRVWIRGADAPSGDTTIPDFPISRDRSQRDKARLLTPVDASRYTYSANHNYTVGGPTTAYNNNGQFVWFWITWGINVNAYIDLFAAELGADNYPGQQKEYYGAWVASKEHYPVIPGRTTVLETRAIYDAQINGRYGNVAFSGVETINYNN
jgi:hypothetical protein